MRIKKAKLRSEHWYRLIAMQLDFGDASLINPNKLDAMWDQFNGLRRRGASKETAVDLILSGQAKNILSAPV